jgi:hypothetical protein
METPIKKDRVYTIENDNKVLRRFYDPTGRVNVCDTRMVLQPPSESAAPKRAVFSYWTLQGQHYSRSRHNYRTALKGRHDSRP